MFENKERRLKAAYGKGMEKARQSGALEQIGEGMVNLILPDSMGAEEYQSYKAAITTISGATARRVRLR